MILMMMTKVAMIMILTNMKMIAVMNMTVVRIVAMMVRWCKIGASKAETSRCSLNSPTSPNLNSTTLSSPESPSASVAANFYELVSSSTQTLALT